MCGINGIFSFSGERDSSTAVKAMNDALAHRGPDDSGIFSEGGLTLGHRRLSIIDLSDAGHQPMQYSHGGRMATLIFNGELYNFREVRKKLQQEGLSFKTESDSEVLLAAWMRWGKAALQELNGMFAFALWDHETRKLWIVRDRLGIKPLYYWCSDSEIIFSSELRSLIQSGRVPKRIDPTGLEDFLRYQTVHAPRTILQGVQMLMPGQWIEASAETQPVMEYWWQPKIKPLPVNAAEAQRDVLDLLRAAVERRLVADVPFGAFLSGGIDSSAVVALMSEVSSSAVKTFSVTFDDSEFSESRYARLIAKKFKTDHHEIVLSPNDFLDELPAALRAMDHPSGDGPNTYVVSKATKKAGITMALSGLGGDELFAGYDIFKRALSLEKKAWLRHTPRVLRAAGGGMLKMLRPGIASEKMAAVLALPELRFEKFYPLSRRVLLDSQIRQVLGHEATSENAVSNILEQFPTADNEHRLSQVSLAEISTYMQNVLLRDADQMSMAHALELRVPFLDYTLVEYVLGLGDAVKFPHTPKQLLVDALGDRLPREIVDRPKMGFTFPWQRWLKNELRDFCETQIRKLAARELFDKNGVEHLWKSYLNGTPGVTWSRVWGLIVLEHWLSEHGIDG